MRASEQDIGMEFFSGSHPFAERLFVEQLLNTTLLFSLFFFFLIDPQLLSKKQLNRTTMHSSLRTRTNPVVTFVALLLLVLLSAVPWFDTVSSAPVETCKTAFQIIRVQGSCSEYFLCNEGRDPIESGCLDGLEYDSKRGCIKGKTDCPFF